MMIYNKEEFINSFKKCLYKHYQYTHPQTTTTTTKPAFYPQQIDASLHIFSQFSRETPLGLLVAPMQSGKTTTFLLTAYLMLASKRVNHIVVMCGSNETELHQQLKSDFMHTFKVFLSLCPTEYRENVNPATSSFKIYKSDKLKHIQIKDRTLVIWDESHYAQSIENKPFQMFQNNGLTISGTQESATKWNDKHSFLLSVSATPFAEKINTYNEQVKHKFVYYMTPAPTYRSVEYYYMNDRIQTSMHTSNDDYLTEVLRDNKQSRPTYGIIRKNPKTPNSLIKKCANQTGWKVIFYDREHQDVLGPKGLNALADAPTQDTIIVLKNMCRMGKVVPKQHISFVYEFSNNTRTDTFLQSLLGRMCGYGPFNPEHTNIYLSPTITKPPSTIRLNQFKELLNEAIQAERGATGATGATGAQELELKQQELIDNFNRSEIEKYIDFMKGMEISPMKAKNVSGKVELCCHSENKLVIQTTSGEEAYAVSH